MADKGVQCAKGTEETEETAAAGHNPNAPDNAKRKRDDLEADVPGAKRQRGEGTGAGNGQDAAAPEKVVPGVGPTVAPAVLQAGQPSAIDSFDDCLVGTDWQPHLGDIPLGDIKRFLKQEIQRGVRILPRPDQFLRALINTPLHKVRAVILGQDPYKTKEEACGLAFSSEARKIPKSLKNIYKEILHVKQLPNTLSADLRTWADQGVLLLNTCLSLRENETDSHKHIGWNKLTDRIIETVDKHSSGPVVFFLWGLRAQEKRPLIRNAARRHLILCTSHPSPLSVSKGFQGCGHFDKANEFFIRHHQPPIVWLPPGPGNVVLPKPHATLESQLLRFQSPKTPGSGTISAPSEKEENRTTNN